MRSAGVKERGSSSEGGTVKIEMIGDDGRDEDNRDLEDDKKLGPQRRSDTEVATTDNDNDT